MEETTPSMARSAARLLVTLTWSTTAALAIGCAVGTSDGGAETLATTPAEARDAGATAKLPPSSETENESPTDAAAPPVDAATKKDAGTDAGSSPPPDAAPSAGLAEGDLLVSEVMFNPSGTEPATEWLEIHNTTAAPISLTGLTLKDGATPVHTHTIGAGVVVPAGGYVVLANDKAATIAAGVPAASVVYGYGGGADAISLGNSANGAIALYLGAKEIARGRYGALGFGGVANGTSVQLKTLTYAASGQSSGWCVSQNAWAAGTDKGTPGAAADCP